jgi:hypothetical protein
MKNRTYLEERNDMFRLGHYWIGVAAQTADYNLAIDGFLKDIERMDSGRKKPVAMEHGVSIRGFKSA